MKMIYILVPLSMFLLGFPLLMEHSMILGSLAATCTTLSFLPQVIHTIKTKDTAGISLAMYIMFVFGIFCWLVYGVMSKDIPLMIGNGVTLFLASIVLSLKFKSIINTNS